MPNDQPNPSNPNDPQQPNDPEQKPLKPRRRRRWPWVIPVLFLLLIGLVLLGPTIASTGAVRSIVLGKVNEQLNGTVQIESWSLGWFSPISVSGIRVYDDQKRLILDVPKVQLGISVLDAAKQHFNFGNDNLIEVSSFDVKLDETGKSNLEKLVKTRPSPAAPSAAAGPAPKVPNASGQFTVNFRGTVETPSTPPLFVDPSTVVLKIEDINKPIQHNLKLAYRVGDNTTVSTIQTSGTVKAFENNLAAIDKLIANQDITFQNVNLAAADIFLKKSGQDMKLAGITSGTISVSAQGLTGLSAVGNIITKNLFVAGGPLKGGDQIKIEQIAIPINVTRKVDGSITIIKIEKANVESSLVNASVSGEINEQALLNLSAGKAPGAEGSLSLKAEVLNLPEIAKQLKNTVQLQPGVEITGGGVTEELNIKISKTDIVVSQNLAASAKGTQNGKAIELKPITITAGATARPTEKTPMPELRDIKVAINSAFAQVNGGGESLAKIDFKGNADLGKLQAEAGQFVDFQGKQLEGTADFALGTNGDVLAPDAPISVAGSVDLQNVKVIGFMKDPINQDKLAMEAGGNITRKASAPTGLDKGMVKVTSGDPTSPLMTATASVDRVELAKLAANGWKFAVDTSRLADLQTQYGGLVPALAEQQIKFTSGGLHVNGAGNYDGTTLVLTDPINMSMASLDVSKGGKPLLTKETIRGSLGGSITLGQDKIGANLTSLSLTSQTGLITIGKSDAPLMVSIIPSKNDISGSGTITIASNIKRVADLAQSLGGPTTQPAPAQLRSGQFNGTIALAKAESTKVEFNGQLTNLTVAANGRNALDNEQLTVALTATAPSDVNGKTPITASGKIGSSFVNTTISDVKILLNAAALLDMLQSATVDVQAPDVAKLSALAQSFVPAPAAAPVAPAARGTRARPPVTPVITTEPIAPLDVRGGGATAKLSIARDVASKTTIVNVSDMHLTNLSLRRGERQFDAKQPIALKLVAKVQGDSPDKINVVTVDQLSGSTEFVTFLTSQPVTITNPLAPQPRYAGEFKAQGSIDSALPLLSVLQGADRLPYSGKFDLTQKLATSGSNTTLVGAMNVNTFQVLDAKTRKPVFTENQIAIRNDMGLDMTGHVASINNFSVDMPQSQALAIKANAKVIDWENSRQIQGIDAAAAKLALTYDLEKLWPIIKPMLSPELQAQYKDLKIKGKYTKEFAVSGSFPAHPAGAPQTSFATLNADGSLSLDLLDLPQGITLQDFELPISMKQGVLKTLPATESASRKLQLPPADQGGRVRNIVANTAVANGGALNLDKVTIDLSKTTPMISFEPRHVLLRGAKLTPVLADSLGKIGAFALLGSKDAKGLASMTILEAKDVPLGELLRTRRDVRIRIAIAVENLEMGGLLTQGLGLVSPPFKDGIHGAITGSTITIADGKATTELTLQQDRMVPDSRTGRSVNKPVPLAFKGVMALANLDLKSDVQIPGDALISELAKVFPNGADIPFTGTNGAFKFDAAKFVQENAVKGLIGNIVGGDNKNTGTNSSNRSGGGSSSDPLGNILDQIGGGSQQRNPPRNPNQGR